MLDLRGLIVDVGCESQIRTKSAPSTIVMPDVSHVRSFMSDSSRLKACFAANQVIVLVGVCHSRTE